jgi:hypothetical protein
MPAIPAQRPLRLKFLLQVGGQDSQNYSCFPGASSALLRTSLGVLAVQRIGRQPPVVPHQGHVSGLNGHVGPGHAHSVTAGQLYGNTNFAFNLDGTGPGYAYSQGFHGGLNLPDTAVWGKPYSPNNFFTISTQLGSMIWGRFDTRIA